jgi:hypothetical protein
LTKKDGTLICAYCLKPIKVEHEVEYDDYRYYAQYDTYECDCDECSNDIKYSQEKDDLEEKYNEKLKDDIRKITFENELELGAKLKVLKKKYNIK